MKPIWLMLVVSIPSPFISGGSNIDEFLKRVTKRDSETLAITRCQSADKTLNFWNVEIKREKDEILFRVFNNYKTGPIEEIIRIPADDRLAQTELKRYNNLQKLKELDSERMRLATRRRIWILTDFQLDIDSSKETVMTLFPVEKKEPTQAKACYKYVSKGLVLDIWNNRLRDVQKSREEITPDMHQ